MRQSGDPNPACLTPKSMFLNRHRRPLLLRYKIFPKRKGKGIKSLTKVHLVKAMVFPVLMYGCESWTVKKAECRRMMLLNCGVGEDS